MSTPTYRLWPTRLHLGESAQDLDDPVVVEEPLEIRVGTVDEAPAPLSVTMRTPGHDGELAVGFLYSEGLIESADEIAAIDTSEDPDRPLHNHVDVRLRGAHDLDAARAARSFMSTSACGVCGKSAADSLFNQRLPPLPPGPEVTPELLAGLPGSMRSGQDTFRRTGGIHAAALFDAGGSLLELREDVGRHNAVDKVVGALLLARRLPPGETMLAVSGRIGFEIAQKVLRAGIPILAAVGAPTTLSLRLADRGGLTLIGFLRDDRFNVYAGGQRVLTAG